MRRPLTTWLLIGWTLVVPAQQLLAQGCAMCGGSFAPNDPTTKAINTSIAFLLLAPYTLVAGVAGWLYFRYRRAGSSRRATIVALPWVRGEVTTATHEEE